MVRQSQKDVVVVLALLYDGEVRNKDCAKSKYSKKVEKGIEHRVASPKLKAEKRKAEEEGRQHLS